MDIRATLVALFGCAVLACSSDPESRPAPATFSFEGAFGTGDPIAIADVTAYVMEPRACTQLSDAGQSTLVWVSFASRPERCAFLESTAFCGFRAGEVTAYAAIVRSNVNGGAVPAIAPGTYDGTGQGLVDENGVVEHFWTRISRNDDTCSPDAVGERVCAAALTLDEIAADRVRGSVEIDCNDGTHGTGSFDVPVCGDDATFCASLKGGCGAETTCVP